MCKSTTEGGQRCSAHTRPKVAAASEAVEAAAKAGDMTALMAAQVRWEAAAAEYASTDEGHNHLTTQAATAEAGQDLDTAALLNTVIRKGEDLRAANRETAALIKAVRLSQAAIASPGSTLTRTINDEPANQPAAPLVPDLTPAQRKDWAAIVTEFDQFAPQLKSTGSHRGSGLSASDIQQYLSGIDTRIGSPDSDDEALSRAINMADIVGGMRYSGPRWHREDTTHFDVDASNSQDKRSKAWSAFTHRAHGLMASQTDRALSHPNASTLSYEKAAETRLKTVEELTARPDVPIEYLKSAIKSANPSTNTVVAPAGWTKAREARFDDNSMAMLLAAKDPDSFHRNEAFNQVMMSPLDTLTTKDRKWLASNLHRMPGSEENQRILADSLKSWAQGYGDAAERTSLSASLATSKIPSVQAIGARLAATDSGNGAAVAEPERKKWSLLR